MYTGIPRGTNTAPKYQHWWALRTAKGDWLIDPDTRTPRIFPTKELSVEYKRDNMIKKVSSTKVLLGIILRPDQVVLSVKP